MKPVPIAYIQPMSVLYGSERSLLESLLHLDRARFTPWLILVRDGPLVQEAKRVGFDVHQMPWSANATWKNPVAWVRATVKLAAWLRQHHIQIVQLNLWYRIDGGLIRVAAKLAGAKMVLRNRGMMPTWLSFYDKFWLSRVDRIISVTRAAIQPALTPRRSDLWSRIRPDRIMILPSSRNMDTLVREAAIADGASLRSLGIPTSAPVVGMVAALVPRKRQGLFLRTAALVIQEVPDAWFLVVGDPYIRTVESLRYVQSLYHLAEDLGVLNRVIFTGYRNDAVTLMRQCWVVVLPSRREALGGVLIEAMALGVPVVASAAEGASEIVRDGVTGVLVERQEADEYAKAILPMLRDRAYAARLGEAAKAHAQRFHSPRIVRHLESCYEELCQPAAIERG